MRNLWHNLQHYEGSQYLVEVEVEEVEGCVIPVPLATPVVLLLNHTNIIWYENRLEHQYK